MKLSKKEAGILGAIKSNETIKEKKKQRIELYNKNPSKCIKCEFQLPYEKRHNKFCCKSCAAIYNNRLKRKQIPVRKCKYCNNEINNSNLFFCSPRCHKEYQYNERIDQWKNNGMFYNGAIRRYLKEKYGDKCSCCGIYNWNNKPIIFELEHKDGNYKNNLEDNLCFLCPNCHSQTDTYKGRNRGRGKYYRNVRYKENKSY